VTKSSGSGEQERECGRREKEERAGREKEWRKRERILHLD